MTRNPDSDAAKAWAAKGVEIVKGDFDDVKSLERAFQGANVIFGVTDFWDIWRNPKTQELKRPDQELIAYCYEVELQHGKNLADAAASTASTLERYVFSSMADANKSSGGKYTKLYHMDSKAHAADYAQSLPALKDKFSQVQAPVYFQLGTEWGLPITPKKVNASKDWCPISLATELTNALFRLATGWHLPDDWPWPWPQAHSLWKRAN